MRILITGIGDAFTSRHFGSSALIEAPGGLVQLDCPDLLHRAFREATESAGWRVEAGDVDDIILTHLHGDHCNGLESIAFRRRIARKLGDPRDALRLHTSGPVSARIWERMAPAMDAPMDGRPSGVEDYFDVRVMTEEMATTVAGLEVRCRFTGHPIPTIGLLITAGGATLGWSGDTPFEEEHIRWLSEADLIVHESNLGAAHTPIERLNGLPDELRARMRLIHLPDDFDPACTDLIPLRESEVLEL